MGEDIPREVVIEARVLYDEISNWNAMNWSSELRDEVAELAELVWKKAFEAGYRKGNEEGYDEGLREGGCNYCTIG